MTQEHQSTDVYHLSNLPKNQLWFWIGQNLEPDTPFFNMPMALTIQGEVDPVRFAHAFQQVVNKADALRTIIKLNNGVPQRVVLDKLDYQVKFLDFSNNPDPQKTFDEWATLRCKEIFNLEKKLFDSVLVKLSDNQVMWYWCQHHLICDGWSTALVYRYVSEFYEKSFNENIEELPNFPSFEGYADREQEYRESKPHQHSKEYWEKVLSEPLDTLNFYGRTARDHGVNKAIRMTRDLGVDRTNAIKALCKQKPFKSLSPHLSIFQLISTCLLAYLYRITGNEDLALGTLYHNRATPDDKNTVGFFMETAPLRVNATAKDTFESLYKKTKRTSMEVMRHYRYAPGNPMNNRAYDVAINYNNASYPAFAGMPMSLHWLHTGAWYSHEPLAIQIHDFDATGTFTIAFDFNVGVFDEETRERAIEHFFKCIDAIIEDPAGSITNFNILTDKENELLNGTYRAQQGFELPNVCLHQLFEKQAVLTPDNIAVYNQDVSYSYKELLSRIKKLSAYLKLKGVQIDAPVGLSMSKHPDMIVAMLAILKAGGGYVPLDPAYPNDRLDYMIKDSGIQFLLTQQKILEDLPENQCSIILLDSDWSEINETYLNSSQLSEHPEPSQTKLNPSNLAYVIYTSGSTGDAKGVMIEHKSIVNYTIAAKDAFGFCEQDKVLQFASISFDTAGEEIYPTLISGGTLCLADNSMVGSAKEFLKACEREKITFLDLPTAFWHQITASIIEDNLTLPASIRNVIIGGERAQPQAVANWIESVKSTNTEDLEKSNAKLINTYGPTECTIVSSYCDLNTDNTNRDQEAPIGLPVKNLYAYVLDKNMQPVALGVTGELHMGGVGLARGYLGKPEMTKEKFIPDPFATANEDNVPLSKLYKTGDLVRFREDGLLEYRDRADDQVKIRGFRIEVGEVESALLKIEEIEQGIINVYEDQNKNKQLIAYYVPFADTNLNSAVIRSSLKQSLPDYMLPQHYIELDEIPMTANGKVNRKALPEPNMEDNQNERDIIPLESDAQIKIAKIWLTLPNINQVGLYDNFFDIGGDSLLMMQVISGLEREIQFKSTPRMLVSLNLAQLAKELEVQHPELKYEESKPFDKKQVTLTDKENSIPFFIKSLNKNLFAYYHASTNHTSTKERAILLCYPTGQEYLRIFRCFKLLTKRLTDLGFHVLRFDYFGTGDSDGDAKDCNLSFWIQNISDAIEQLKDKSGLNKISILGLRLGANLATQASANRKDIDTIINWDPIFDGKSNLLNLKNMHSEMLMDKDRFYIKRDSSECDKSELIGFNYSEQLLADIHNIKTSDWSRKTPNKQHFIFSNNEQHYNDGADKYSEDTFNTFDTSISWTDTDQIETSIAPQTIISHICKELLK